MRRKSKVPTYISVRNALFTALTSFCKIKSNTF